MCAIVRQKDIAKLRSIFDPDLLPAAADAERARVATDRWYEALAAADLPAPPDDAPTRRLLDAVFGNSPFLAQCAVAAPAFAARLFADGPDDVAETLMADVAETHAAAITGTTPGPALRRTKRRLALATAVADIAGLWPLPRVTGALSSFADHALQAVCAYLLADAARQGALELADPADPERQSGLVVLGMGKLGARELNYSSDIDLIVLYDTERVRAPDPDRIQHTFVRLTRGLVRLMEERTVDGYVFRTDLRLRPDPGAMPVAMSVMAAEAYYESMGQNWERAAMIKARPVAGDLEAGARFVNQLTPFIWRKNLDFAAIRDIHSIKRQIHAHRGGGTVRLAGHNIKLGRGGIREIEFFTQTQQLIWGGRDPSLRVAVTVEALAALAARGSITDDLCAAFVEAYRFLRRLEHRLQMINDEQTHSLPEDDASLAELATFCGYADIAAFSAAVLSTLYGVEAHYAELFEEAPALSADGDVVGNLVFTGGDPDPGTLATLAGMGFISPETVDDAVRGWHHGRFPATRSARARELLTELMPALLTALSARPDPDAALIAFDRFIRTLPAGVQVFSMIHSNPQLLSLLAEILGDAPRVAEIVGRHASILDIVLAHGFFDPPPPLAALKDEIRHTLDAAADMEAVLDGSRRWANERRFQVGVQALRRLLDMGTAGAAFSDIAEAAITGLLPRIEAEFAEQHGRIEGGGMAVVAMGKLGGREMTAASDLDLIFVYQAPDPGASSDGRRPLPATQYFAWLSQRLINAITAPTAEGRLYEVDMRLRPSGKAGPIATHRASFDHYQRQEAWTWEHMALTRARTIAGPPDLVAAIETTVREALTQPRDRDALVVDVADMRARMDDEHHTESLWHIKHLRGGLVDVEFIAQYLQLAHAQDRPEVLSPNTRAALLACRDAGVVDTAVADDLIGALDLWQRVQGRLRLAIDEAIGADGLDDAPETLRRVVAGIEPALDLQALADDMKARAETVRGHFRHLIDESARAIRPHPPADRPTTEPAARRRSRRGRR